MCLEVRATAGYKYVARCSSLLLFIFLKYICSCLIARYCTYSNATIFYLILQRLNSQILNFKLLEFFL